VSFIIIGIVLFLNSFVLEFYRVESGSMEPELYKGDIVIVSRIAYFGIPYKISIDKVQTPELIKEYITAIPNLET